MAPVDGLVGSTKKRSGSAASLLSAPSQRTPVVYYENDTRHNDARLMVSTRRRRRRKVVGKSLILALSAAAATNLISSSTCSAYHQELLPNNVLAQRRQPNHRFEKLSEKSGLISTQQQRYSTSQVSCLRSSLRDRGENDEDDDDDTDDLEERFTSLEQELLDRTARLEEFVAKQELEIHRLKKQSYELTDITLAFARVLKVLKDSGLDAGGLEELVTPQKIEGPPVEENATAVTEAPPSSSSKRDYNRMVEAFDDALIFGTAPTSVLEAADSAGAAILAAMLGGKQRMLVDVRDAELSGEPEALVQFIELAVLPIAAGLEGLDSARNRVKIVFPTVSQLLLYRKTMALAAPEVVALSTLSFDPVEDQDKLVVIVAPAPDDDEGLAAMEELLAPKNPESQPIQQPVVLLNYHMVPVAMDLKDFETAYHLRLLTVQYMSSDSASDYFQQFSGGDDQQDEETDDDPSALDSEDDSVSVDASGNTTSQAASSDVPEDSALEAAMQHASEVGMQQGITRAMVIRAFPRPWHVFVDTSPGTDTDFEVAATFDEEPSQDQLNFAIVECLEGSEEEEEIVAQQMQQALEQGQLDQVSDMIGKALGALDEELVDKDEDEEEDER